MSCGLPCETPEPACARQAEKHYEQLMRQNCQHTDRLFAALMIFQWLAGILVVCWISPTAWAGTLGTVHAHVWAALGLGTAIYALPLAFIWYQPGRQVTRHLVAIGQMLGSALLIHLSGGRIETHFHIFGSLAFLAFYRDWKVLITGSLVVILDHVTRGLVWPESIYGVAALPGIGRSLEHAGWVVFEDVFLIFACWYSDQGMRESALQTSLLEDTNRRTEERVEQRTHQLAEANDFAQRANQTKSAFLANMSHEIRTPMTAILGYADLLLHDLDTVQSVPKRTEALSIIQRNGEHLLNIINDVLDLSKIEAEKLTLDQVSCSPIQLLRDVESLMRVRASAKNLELRIEPEGPLPRRIVSDPTRLRQILINLVGNAIKFTEIGSVRVLVRGVRTAPSRLEIDVVDTGLGMTSELMEKLFEPFVQADSSSTRKIGGTGLGLAISRRLAERLGGTVRILQSQPHHGTTLRLTLPALVAELEDVQNPEVAPTRASAASSKTDTALPPGCRILLAEDGPDNQRLITFILRKAGAEVAVVENGRLAVDAALAALQQGTPFDLILMDMQMPVMGGHEATSLLRAEGYPGTIIALTANAMAGDRDKCLACGCNEFASKPIDRLALIQLIAAQLAHPSPTGSSMLKPV